MKVDRRDGDRTETSGEVISAFLFAIETRDLAAIATRLAPGVRWSNVPHPPAVGREAVVAMLDVVVGRSERVRWDVVSAAYDGERAHVERVDRFWIGGVEYAVACHGVFVVDLAAGQITEVRDYVDLGEWRGRLADVVSSTVAHD